MGWALQGTCSLCMIALNFNTDDNIICFMLNIIVYCTKSRNKDYGIYRFNFCSIINKWCTCISKEIWSGKYIRLLISYSIIFDMINSQAYAYLRGCVEA